MVPGLSWRFRPRVADDEAKRKGFRGQVRKRKLEEVEDPQDDTTVLVRKKL